MMIVSFLKTTEAQYENLRLELWLRWCEAKSMSTREWQQLMANGILNRWFNTELTKIEWQFMHDLEPYQRQCSPQELNERYKAYMVSMHSLILAPVQNEIRKKTTKQLKHEDFNTQTYLN
ncbi:MAG TPA: hypothetical protein VK050_08525 [Flavobacteriaceae bacterium]|nr:hypothetical protein [Flavobacteriaceae bacterium]